MSAAPRIVSALVRLIGSHGQSLRPPCCCGGLPVLERQPASVSTRVSRRQTGVSNVIDLRKHFDIEMLDADVHLPECTESIGLVRSDGGEGFVAEQAATAGRGVFADTHLYAGRGDPVDDFAAIDGEVYFGASSAVSGAGGQRQGSEGQPDVSGGGGILPSTAKSAHTGSQTSAETNCRTPIRRLAGEAALAGAECVGMRWEHGYFAALWRTDTGVSAASQSTRIGIALAVAADGGVARCADWGRYKPAMGAGDGERTSARATGHF